MLNTTLNITLLFFAMIYAYIRVSTDKQTVVNQRYEILKYAAGKKINVEEWIEETVSGRKRSEYRKLGIILTGLKKNDILIVSELSRLGRSTGFCFFPFCLNRTQPDIPANEGSNGKDGKYKGLLLGLSG
ncbi:hypothetical protein Dfri01_46540 [Dyadobacter frigoris]|uniref:recombinase family protein n=1 Tax=Dyadobacter frigoris TaxID=2576211 RepID=UPI0024A60428|nr:recombinase family protein [Dyadobacter frigoris]GLU55193.1 hypothetical protein Dfri01_46540 [Dyadobacter frigoris]